jgi:ethanolaminephosphotransferase
MKNELFCCKDTVEVDNNVTRNLWPELTKFDWDVMILHYLGLDHAGHLRGSHRYHFAFISS